MYTAHCITKLDRLLYLSMHISCSSFYHPVTNHMVNLSI